MIAMSIFVAIASLTLTQIRNSRSHYQEQLQEAEILNQAKMAIQTGEKGEVEVRLSTTQIMVYENGKEIWHVVKY